MIARRCSSTVLHVLLLQGGEKMTSRISFLQDEVALDLISKWDDGRMFLRVFHVVNLLNLD